MPAYWRCLKWARAQSFAQLDQRAIHGLVYTQLWEQPDKYRGKLIRLRLHLQRILDWEAPENSAGVRRVYEAWGWTDESKSFPYVVVLSDVPKGIPLGDNLHEEGLFVGYFLKTMAYTAYNRNRSSPLLLGRMEWLPSTAPAHPIVGRRDWVWITAVGIPVVLLIVAGTWYPDAPLSVRRSFRPRRRPTRRKWKTGSATRPRTTGNRRQAGQQSGPLTTVGSSPGIGRSRRARVRARERQLAVFLSNRESRDLVRAATFL